MKSVFSLLLTTLTMLISINVDSANADVISPSNSNATAFRIKLARPEADYVPFKIMYGAKEIAPNVPVPIDGRGTCLSIVATGATNSWTNHCAHFISGTITDGIADITIFGLKLNGKSPHEDGIYGNVKVGLSIETGSGPLLTVSTTIAKFENAKLYPFFTTMNNELSVQLFGEHMTLPIDLAKGTAEYNLPIETLAPIAIKRVHTKSFADFREAELTIKRQPQYSPLWRVNFPTERTFSLTDLQHVSIDLLLMPWMTSDSLQINFNYGGHTVVQQQSYHIGTGKRYLPAERYSVATYPNEISIYRIDVDDITVTSHNHKIQSVKGSYAVYRLDSGDWQLIATQAPTRTGIDVISGVYRVLVNYVDPITQTNERKVYDLNYK